MKFEILLAALASLALMFGLFKVNPAALWRRVKYPTLLATFAFVALVCGAVKVGVFAGVTAMFLVFAWQLLLLSRSKRTGACFLTALSDAQTKEFTEMLRELGDLKDKISEVVRDFPGVKAGVDGLRRLSLSRGGSGEVRPGQLVSDGCAEYLAAVAIVGAEKKGKLDLLEPSQREALLSRSSSILGIRERSALTSSDVPMPIQYTGEVVQLVNAYGSARKYGTVFPLGTGTVKLPRLTTDPTFGLIAASATVTEKSPQLGFVTFTAEKFGGLVRFPSEIMDDSIVALGNWIADYCARNIALAEDYNFFSSTGAGSGVNGSVKGLCLSTIDNSKVVQMGSTKTHFSDATLSNVRALRQVPDAAALNEGAYYMHPSFEQLLASFNTAGDRPYNPTAQLQNPSAAQPFITGPTLDGFPVRWVPAMPAYSTGANVSKVFMLFGAMRYQYLGVLGAIRMQTSIEAAFETDEILIRALERFTIGLMATGAIGGLETAAS